MSIGRLTTEAELDAFVRERTSQITALTRQLRATVIECVGSPQGQITAPVGTLCVRRDGTPGATLYVKESGTGNTGWTAK